eukprot:COSAG02_NODE_29179_length_574_cov_1.176842_1_plen_98_part_00
MSQSRSLVQRIEQGRQAVQCSAGGQGRAEQGFVAPTGGPLPGSPSIQSSIVLVWYGQCHQSVTALQRAAFYNGAIPVELIAVTGCVGLSLLSFVLLL